MGKEEVAFMWQSKFGIPEEVFKGFSFYRKAQSIWICSNAVLPELSYETIGMRLISLKDLPWKPTTAALRIFGRYATKNSVCLTLEQARIFMAGGSQIIQPSPEMDSGYVIVMYNESVLGCGLYSNGKLISQIPKESRITLEEGEEI